MSIEEMTLAGRVEQTTQKETRFSKQLQAVEERVAKTARASAGRWPASPP